MARGKGKSADTYDAPEDPDFDVTDVDTAVEAQQASVEAGTGQGYVGGMSADEKDAFAAKMEKQLNVPEDQQIATRIAPAVLGRDPDAELTDDELNEDTRAGQSASRVGSLTVEHPRARMASALHDRLKGQPAQGFTADELSGHAEKVGLNVDGSGANGAVLKADLVYAMDTLAAEHPRG